jgi:hypothetical protein
VIEYACAGPGGITVRSLGSELIDNVLESGCDGSVEGLTAPGDAKDLPAFTGTKFTLQIAADASAAWEVYVGDRLSPLLSA